MPISNCYLVVLQIFNFKLSILFIFTQKQSGSKVTEQLQEVTIVVNELSIAEVFS